MPDYIWSILTAPLSFSKPGFWNIFKEIKSEKSPHLNVLTCCAALVPKPSAVSQFRIPKLLHLQSSFAVPSAAIGLLLLIK